MEEQEPEEQTRFIQLVNNKWRFKGFLLQHLPMAFLAGLTIQEANDEHAAVSVSLNFLTKNPFRSIYFACLAMAAELSTGILAMNIIEQTDKNFSVLVTGLEVEFTKKATGKITFHSTDGTGFKTVIEECINEQKESTYTATSIGINQEGVTVATFKIQWSFKPKD